MKFLAMEELPDYRRVRGILGRSFIFRFIVGDVEYNIKDVIRYAGDPKLKPLNDELMDLRKLLFAYRLMKPPKRPIITNANSFTVSGTAEADSIVKVYDGGSTQIGNTVTAGTSGSWSVGPITLSEGPHSLTATASNAASTSPASQPVSISVWCGILCSLTD